MRLLIMTPAALLAHLERAAQGESPEDLMMAALDEAMSHPVNLSIEEDEPEDG